MGTETGLIAMGVIALLVIILLVKIAMPGKHNERHSRADDAEAAGDAAGALVALDDD